MLYTVPHLAWVGEQAVRLYRYLCKKSRMGFIFYSGPPPLAYISVLIKQFHLSKTVAMPHAVSVMWILQRFRRSGAERSECPPILRISRPSPVPGRYSSVHPSLAMPRAIGSAVALQSARTKNCLLVESVLILAIALFPELPEGLHTLGAEGLVRLS